MVNILPVFAADTHKILDKMFKLDIKKICFDFSPERVIAELKEFTEKVINAKDTKEERYIINFYETQKLFLIDISGTLKKENLMPLKLMFKNYLGDKVKELRGVLYIFNSTDDKSINFQNTWALFRFWEEIGIDYSKVYYLAINDRIKYEMHKYIEPIGVGHMTDLIDVVKKTFPEYSAVTDEQKLFDIASSLLQQHS